MAAKRIAKELADMKKDPPTGFTVAPESPDNIFIWSGYLLGPSDSPFEGGIFSITITFPQDYPFKPPQIKFITKIFHPSISSTGSLCSHCFLPREQWSPAITIWKFMGIVCELLKTPIDCCNANSEVFDLFLRDESKYFTFAREGTIKYAMDPGDELLRQSLGKKNSNSTSDAK